MPGREAIPKVSNWGRWGTDDEKGTANFITPEVIVAAARLVRKGQVFCCCIPIDQNGPVFPTRTPPQRFMSILNVPVKEIGLAGSAIANDDYITMYLQGSTQWDSLAHVGYDGKYYNDVPASAITAHGGASKNDIGKLYQSFVTRGVLLDMVGYKGCEADGHLPSDYPITIEDLDGCCQAQNVEVRSGTRCACAPAGCRIGIRSKHRNRRQHTSTPSQGFRSQPPNGYIRKKSPALPWTILPSNACRPRWMTNSFPFIRSPPETSVCRWVRFLRLKPWPKTALTTAYMNSCGSPRRSTSPMRSAAR